MALTVVLVITSLTFSVHDSAQHQVLYVHVHVHVHEDGVQHVFQCLQTLVWFGLTVRLAAGGGVDPGEESRPHAYRDPKGWPGPGQ